MLATKSGLITVWHVDVVLIVVLVDVVVLVETTRRPLAVLHVPSAIRFAGHVVLVGMVLPTVLT